jgi:hypothetical protein
MGKTPEAVRVGPSIAAASFLHRRPEGDHDGSANIIGQWWTMSDIGTMGCVTLSLASLYVSFFYSPRSMFTCSCYTVLFVSELWRVFIAQ